MKSWFITYTDTITGERNKKIIVKAQNEKDARSFALDSLYRENCIMPVIVSCKEIDPKEKLK